MHIAIDAHSVGTRLGGNETYATNLIEALAEVDSVNRYTLYVTRREAVERFGNRWPNVRVRLTLPHTPLVRIPLTLSVELRRRPVDILHVQYTSPPFTPCPVVNTIHDLSFEHLPETFKRRSWRQMRLTIRRSAQSAAHIITDSEYSRNDILTTYSLPPDRVTATPLAASSRFRPVGDSSELERVRKKYGISGDYILTVGSIQPRKNMPRLIRAYAQLCREAKLESIPKLIVAGKRAWLFDDTLDAAENSAVRDQILFVGYVPEEDLPALYTAAKCFVYPSYFEGFGIPTLEAMRCGTPTITSDRTCFPEIIGDAGLMVDPFDERAILEVLVRVLGDEKLRKELSEKGTKRASLYDWKETARQTLKVYDRVHAEKRNTQGRAKSVQGSN
ncbi:MAG TPA: glycosyltransferase family 1 protein [Pyrinomonadaceae bacterium]|nr:glycosyltransferase family 1 protein [Pyrinomonadaceae bacterium]